jgi:hypothetical protein
MYNQYYPIDIPKGPHKVTVSNSGGGRIVTSFELKNYILKNGPDLEVRGLRTDDYILLWLKNQKFTVLHELVKIPSQEQPEGILEIEHVPDGIWLAEWINTIDASEIKRELVESKNEKLILNTPVIDKSIAVRLRKL